ncbi:unnamed protein product [Rotaria magnacalcarata]|uniref:L antigen family member 3 n=1 Tax=Rotaria magnacalcarata TaxID=392030 RepID=A0A816VPR6_9BILA|nr:unnamed protein product [Rotaria magnacalcarata]CAF2137479.1 unnamed protein product [Rotaria magnacalcarata]
MDFTCELRFPLSTARHAQIIYDTIRIDKEPKKTVERIETLDGNVLNVRFEAHEAKFIRVAVESYIEKINLILRTMQRFDPKHFTRINHEQPLNEYTQSSSLNVIVFVDKQQCNSESDDTCRQQRSQLEQIRHLCTSANIQFAISTNITIAEKYFNIYGSLPKLCFLRNGFPVIYSGLLSNMDSLQEWLSEARERLTHVLDDKSFEHDTQASTGSTTGDWFILFKKTNDSRSLLPIWEATALQLRNRAIFAYVNVDTNPIIQKRFHLFYLPIFILFKQGKMYRYESASWKQISFIEFIENNYKKVKAENVPAELSAFALFSEKAAKVIPMYLIVIPMICLAAVLLVLVSGLARKKKTTAERTPFQVKID